MQLNPSFLAEPRKLVFISAVTEESAIPSLVKVTWSSSFCRSLMLHAASMRLQSIGVSSGFSRVYFGVSRKASLALLAGAFVVSRILAFAAGVRFDMEPLDNYWQFIDPALLRNDFWRSIFYLHHQPPVFNMFLGAILHLFPSRPAIGFHWTFLVLGFVLPLCLFELMERMGIDRWIAFVIALAFTLSPSTILYENLLFYEYPLTVLLAIAALFLHRFASEGRIRDGFVFFSSLALVAGIRTVYHLVWFVLILISVFWFRPQWRRQVAFAAALPAVLLGAFYLKHLIVFHGFTPGSRIYSNVNLTQMITLRVPKDDIEKLIQEGKITPLLKDDIYTLGDDFDKDPSESEMSKIVPVPPKTGIPILDDCIKSTTAFNWNCMWAENAAEMYRRDAMVVFRNYPGGYFRSLGIGLQIYFWPDTDGWPMDGREDVPNALVLAEPLDLWDLITSGEWDDSQPWLAYFGLPGLLLFGLFGVWRSVAKKTVSDASNLTLAFMVLNAVYLSVVIIVLAPADQNRYRSEVSAYFAVLLGLALQMVSTRVSRRHAEACATNPTV